MVTTNLNLQFPDEKSRDDFEIAFRGWLKQYQQQATVTYAIQGRLAQQAGGQQAGGQQAGLQGGQGGGGAHSFGGGQTGQAGIGSGAGLWGGGEVNVPIYGTVSSGYVNFIGGW